MPTFAYRARTPDGRTTNGVVEAADAAEASRLARRDGAALLDLGPAGASGRRRSVGDRPAWHPSWLLPVTSFDVELGLWQLSSMLRSGVPVLAALETVADQARRPRAARIWCDVSARIRQGESLGDAMERHGRVFGPYIVQLVRVGEHSGEMDIALSRGAEHLAMRRDARMMLANALVYPAITILMAIGVSAYLVLAVIPKVAEFLESSGASLPAMTQGLLDLSAWLRANGPATLAIVAALVVGFALVRRTAAGREATDALALRIPPFAGVLRLSGTAVFARGVGLLVESGVSLLDALRVVAQLLGNRRLSRRVLDAAAAVTRGGTLSGALEEAPEFLPMLPRMTAVAEATGTLAETMAEIAAFHERMLVLAIKRLTSMIEPVVIVFTGLVVGYVYISFFLALFSMAGAA